MDEESVQSLKKGRNLFAVNWIQLMQMIRGEQYFDENDKLTALSLINISSLWWRGGIDPASAFSGKVLLYLGGPCNEMPRGKSIPR